MSTLECTSHDPNNVFRKFNLLEFPTTFVGLSATMELNLGFNVTDSAYVKTMYNGNLLEFQKAREVSAAHRAFIISFLNERTLQIIFNPINECIPIAIKQRKSSINRFVFDLRVIKADGTPCCNKEEHAEVGRFYICGQYEYCSVSHSPEIIDFGEVMTTTRTTGAIRLKNDSSSTSVQMNFVKVAGFDVTPSKFTLLPNSFRRLVISFYPNGLKVANSLEFHMRNSHNSSDDSNDNFLKYFVTVRSNVILNCKKKEIAVRSVGNLKEPCKYYTYLGKELTIYNKRKEIANQLLEFSKSRRVKVVNKEKIILHGDCYSEHVEIQKNLSYSRIEPNFCKKFVPIAKVSDLFSILITPFVLKFGKVAFNSYGEQDLSIKNNSNYDITIKFLRDNHVLYTKAKISQKTIHLKPHTATNVTIIVFGSQKGQSNHSFSYLINNKFCRCQVYSYDVGDPILCIPESNLKLGMITTESFVTAVPVKIYNYYNVPVSFEWGEISPETPLETFPRKGTVPSHSCRLCEVTFSGIDSKATKSKVHDLVLISKNEVNKEVLLEATVVTRKLSIKFTQSAVIFKDIALNLETVESVKLENSSREMALFYVIEPLLPGVTVEPMSGVIRPRMIISFILKVKFMCPLEFSFEMFVKINNKENIGITISGNVVEPKLNISPKNIYMPRVPCGLITYVPINIQNTTQVKNLVEILHTEDDDIFNVYMQSGYEKEQVSELVLEAGHTKTVFIKVHDIYRREYDMYVPFRINRLLGPPNKNSETTQLEHYIGEYERLYENNPRVRLKPINKDISYCHIGGVITVPWIQFSTDRFEIDFNPNGVNSIDFTMTNISKYVLMVTIIIAKLSPNFSLTMEDCEMSKSENHIKFEFNRNQTVSFSLSFHPKCSGKFVSTATMFLDKALNLPYSNLTFVGRRELPKFTPSTTRIIFPPCHVKCTMSRQITLLFEGNADINTFRYACKDDNCLKVEFIKLEEITNEDATSESTVLTVEISVSSKVPYGRTLIILFHHEEGSVCDVEVIFYFSACLLTLHANSWVKPEDNPYPFYPLKEQTELYEYLETCTAFLERWLFQQGFRRDLYPEIPTSFFAIAAESAVTTTVQKSRGISVTYNHFFKRIAGTLVKHMRKKPIPDVDENIKCVLENHDNYRQIIHLLRSRGSNLWIQAKYLLSYDQFVMYNEYEPPKYSGDFYFTQMLIKDEALFQRLSKQLWNDFILQSYKVFVIDSCFFDCVCVNGQTRDIIKVLLDWYNEQLTIAQHSKSGKHCSIEAISNITTDLQDGTVICVAISNHCPFLKEHFAIIAEIDKNDREAGIIHNACLIIEAMNMLRLFFPLCSNDFLNPNFMQMLFLSIHLYIVLPMFKQKTNIEFSPPLLKSSTRLVTLNPVNQESLIFNHVILQNNKNSFVVEKGPAGENGKKMFLTVKYTPHFVEQDSAILLIHGYNKTRIFDTYVTFELIGTISSLAPIRKYKLTAPIYRPNKVDIQVFSPFATNDIFETSWTEIEPSIPVVFQKPRKPGFYVSRIKLMDDKVYLTGNVKENLPDFEHKLYLQIFCLSTQVVNSWIWFRSENGEFFIKVTIQPRCDVSMETLPVQVQQWPLEPCSCGEACECYRTTILMIPHRNDNMIKALRLALMEHATETMMNIFDNLISTPTGHIVLLMFLAEGGTNISEIAHILRPEITYRITSRTLMPRTDRVTFRHHTDAVLALPITISPGDSMEKGTITFTSNCGMDIRNYRILFIDVNNQSTLQFSQSTSTHQKAIKSNLSLKK